MVRVTSDSSAAASWAALAPLLAGQPRVRLSRDGGKSYPQKHERDLTEGLPTSPAAVRIFGKDGTCRAIFLDFDSSGIFCLFNIYFDSFRYFCKDLFNEIKKV